MTIGDLLKKYRINMDLTLNEMAGDILSTSYYAKVEKDQHRISAEDLLRILDIHSIPLGSFFSQLNQNNVEIFNQEAITSLYYAGDVAGLKNLAEVHKTNESKHSDLAFALIESCLYDLDEYYNVSQTSLKMIREKIFSLPNWELFKLTLYSNFISFYDIHTNHGIISTILSKDKEKFNKREQIAIITSLLNFVSELVDEAEFSLANYYLQQVAQRLKPLPELMFYHVIYNFYNNFVAYKTQEDEKYLQSCQYQIDFLNENGYEAVADQFSSHIKTKASN